MSTYEKIHLQLRRAAGTVLDFFFALFASMILVEVVAYAVISVSKIFGIELWTSRIRYGVFFETWRTKVVVMAGQDKLRGMILLCIPTYLVLILLSPLKLGRRIMRLAVEDRIAKSCSIGLFMARESVKYLWLLPIFWVSIGLSIFPPQLRLPDLFASIADTGVFAVFPTALALWVFGRGKWTMHDSVCGTYVKAKTSRLPGIVMGVVGSFIAGCGLFFVLRNHGMRSYWEWLKWSTELPEGYEGLPHFAETMEWYTGAVLVWTLIVFAAVRLLNRPGFQEGKPTAMIGS